MRACSKSVQAADTPGVQAAAQCLAAGGLVVYPTETLYGLGADATNVDAVDRLIAVKGRESGKPISVIVANAAMAATVVAVVPPVAATLMDRFWPGPLTIVLEAAPTMPAPLTAGTGTIGLRVSSHPVAAALVRELGRPVTTPSANPAGQPPPVRLEAAVAYFGDRVDLYLDGGPVRGEPASTVVDARGVVRILRPGAIPAEVIETAVASSHLVQ